MNNKNSTKNLIYTCDINNLQSNFKELSIDSYNNHGAFYITGIYSKSEVAILRNNLDLLYKKKGNNRVRLIKDIKDIGLKKKLSKVFMNHSVLNLMSDIFQNSDVSLLPTFEVVKNYLPHSLKTNTVGWHRDCGGEEGIKECKSILSNKEYVFGKIGLYLQENSDYGGSIDVIPGSNKDYFRFLKTWQAAKFWIIVLSLLQKHINPVYKVVTNTKLIKSLLGATTVNTGEGGIVVFDSRIWHKGTPAHPSIEKNLVYHHDSIQADLPAEKTKYVLYCQFGNSLGIKSYFIDRLKRDGNSNEMDIWIEEAMSLDKSGVDTHEFFKKRSSFFDGTFKDLFGLF
jgi:hypothetical protein